ncbi:metal-sensing transcriptional repressor [Oceanotoga sp. DSM 15011]|jgi:DNA-binding FrmR family transcriptional regulator|uniref:Copper-sensing transcriptional repressor CsoR n=1 Tax=Oceanotoga teriensis TaxID=515440 RepID=A0AA45HIX5_9BACT|nr:MULTISPECIES: metal-sensing transcriptional repressor [Oceanotoga]MDN5342174.1 CsoR family transcriptional regulator, copper-sensing transcriptional repressor [Oceanotoga sp.]MDO7976199.1 metal-sensing transcriptional repressor [Oceanotoga teriensis]PWJ95396.1 DNA-binding FrmR family transcriptional regulator [Oceanotoga teriensis]UYP01035.1 metal-sensing transcriptional repressor [Oceanotoga sp. DSM 15011]
MKKHQNALKILKTARGQTEAAIKMIEDEKYCIDISNQVLASIALLKKANTIILKNHIESCVKEAAFGKDENEINEKLKELENVISYLNKNM